MATALTGDANSQRVEAALSAREVAEGTPTTDIIPLPATAVAPIEHDTLFPVWVESEMNVLREQWYEYAKVLLGPIPSRLPRFREVNHEINLIDDTLRIRYRLPKCPEALQPLLLAKVERYTTSGWWEMKAVSQAMPLLCIPKKGSSGLRTVVDARLQNENTHKDVTPFPEQDQIWMDVARARYRTKIDMSDAYEQIRIRPSDVPKTSFSTTVGTFVSHVMQQGDCNAPATFQRLMTWIFRKHLGKFVRVYLDDVFVYSDSIEDHESHLKIVFDILAEQELHLSRKKLDCYSLDMDCLGHRIDNDGLHADSDKMGRVCEWRALRSYPEVQRFLGLVNYLSSFMPDLSAYTSPIEAICRNGQPFIWRAIHQSCLDRIKALARKSPILRPIDMNNPDRIWVITDASSGGVGAMYGQGPDWQTCRPAGFMSKKFSSAQRSYKTYEHEALAVIEALLKWEDKLIGREFWIATDHEALETIKTTNRDGTSGRLIRWDEFLSRFNYHIVHVPGSLNKVADCLSRYYENDRFDEVHDSHHYVSADARLDPNHDDLPDIRVQELLEAQPPTQILARRLRDREEDRVAEADVMAAAVQKLAAAPVVVADNDTDIRLVDALQTGPELRSRVLGDSTFMTAVMEGYEGDTLFARVLGNPHHYKTFRIEAGVIFTKSRLLVEVLCLPRATLGKRSLAGIVIDHAHEILGHLGAQKTSEYLRRWFWWPRMGKDCDKFCLSCAVCQMSKTSNQKAPGLLHNMPIPAYPWQSIGMDFVGPFPVDGGFDYLWVIICRLTSLVHLVPLSVRVKTTELAWFYVRDVVRLHGMPETIVSDRDSKFTAKFWRELHRIMGTKLLMSTSFHPPTDGQSERAIRSIGQIMRSTVAPDQRDWVSKIPLVEFAINSSINSSTGFAPFELTYGFMPRFIPFPPERLRFRGVAEFAQTARATLEMAHDAIIEARVASTYHANQRRSEETPHKVGDKVYLSTKNLNLPKHRARKLAPKFIGPFRVTAAWPATSDYDLELSPELIARQIHPRFHASLLRAFEPNDDQLFPSRESKRFYDFGMPDDDEWLVDEVFGHRVGAHGVEFAVRWTAGDTTWEPYSNVDELEALDQYFALQGVSTVQELTPGAAPRPHPPPRRRAPRAGPARAPLVRAPPPVAAPVLGGRPRRPRQLPARFVIDE